MIEGSSNQSGAPPAPNWSGQASGAADVVYGGFWLRVVAAVIDSIVVYVAGFLIGFVVSFLASFTMAIVTGHNAVFPAMTVGLIIQILVNWLYFALMESSARGATLGKMAVGLKVVTGEGRRLTFANATGRFLAKILSAAILCIGFLMVAFTDRKRGLHDMIASTLVVKVR